MPKMKTRRAAAKRYRTTGSGKVKVARANKQHILTKKSSKRKRQLRGMNVVDPADAQNLRRVLPYG
jgi:large subunit ribosomal protein L35